MEDDMTFLQHILTPGQPLYWLMLCIPNSLVLVWAIKCALRTRWFILVGVAAVANMLAPWMTWVMFVRGNGLNAPGTPHWFNAVALILRTNAQTVCLLLLVPVLIVCRQRAVAKELSNQQIQTTGVPPEPDL